jgi:hypothetical protein
MKTLSKRIAFLLLCGVMSCAPMWAQAQRDGSGEPLTNAAVVKLVRAGFKEKTVIAIVNSQEPRFDLSTARMIELKKSGVSERIILAMLARQQGMEVLDDAWSDDPFFDNSTTTSKPKEAGQNSDPSRGNSVDIFGSGGSTRGSSKTRGGINGSVEDDTVTTGTATVRIIRPPAEAGTTGVKLEKVPTLNDDAIVELVEAGFSEGTIIRRIEQSPVDFDLSAQKLDDLRKHRVSDKILTAMKAAMGDAPSGSKPAGSNGTPEK